MTAATEIRYVALKPLLLQTGEGERLPLAPGDEIPAATHGRWLHLAIEAGKAAPAFDIAGCSDTDLSAELVRRGYKVTKTAGRAKTDA